MDGVSLVATIIGAVKNAWDLIKHPILHAKENRKMKGHGFSFNSVTKHVTVYNNGHGIMINDHNIRVNDKELFSKFKRKVDVSDGKNSVNFPTFKHIKKTDKSKRFTDYGFWDYSKDNIITNSHYENWDKARKNNKVLKWVFDIDHAKVKEGKSYNLGYVVSIPGMFRIDNGYAEKSKHFDGKMSSSIDVAHKSKVVKFDISFEDGIKLESAPKCIVYYSRDSDKGKYIPAKEKTYNALYTKYSYEIKNPRIGNIIEVSWIVQKDNN